MALIKCKECGKEISDTANKCIHCGCPLHNENNNGNKQVSNVYIWLVAILPFLSVLLLWVVWYLLESYFIGMIIMIVVFCILSIVLIKLDYTSLKNRGVDVTPFGKFSLFKIVIPKYIYKRANILKQSLSYFVVWIICVIFYCIVIVVGFNPLVLFNLSIKQVQNGILYDCPNYTVNELINSSIMNPKWESETTFNGNTIVMVNGKIDYEGKKSDIVIEYIIKGDEFLFNDIKVDGESKNIDLYNEIIDHVCNINTSIDNEKEINKVREIDSIDDYGYVLLENDTIYYKELFKELKEVLSQKDVNENQYVELVAKMFIADFFNLDNKLNKNDVGGIEFIYRDYQSNFKQLAISSIYNSIESNNDGQRIQKLPVVLDVEVSMVKQETYNYGDSTDRAAYLFDFYINYAEDLGYQTEGSLALIHNGNKIEVASMSEKSTSE